jgi:hypothetical protein
MGGWKEVTNDTAAAPEHAEVDLERAIAAVEPSRRKMS